MQRGVPQVVIARILTLDAVGVLPVQVKRTILVLCIIVFVPPE